MNITNHEITYGSIGIELGFCFNNNITGNIFKNNFQSGIRILFSDWNNIRENTIESNNHNGIYITLSENNTIENNSINSNYEDGIESHQCVNNIYTANFISNHVWGIVADMSTWNEFINNTIKNNKMGVHLGSNSRYNNISRNLILSSWLGISLDSSRWNSVFENIITNSSYYGIRVYSTSYSNKIFHNNFFKNKNQAFDATNNGNYWDDGYPSGGNFWSDYTGFDNFSGPGQNISGSDGIGDTPYVIDPDSIDNYPLMTPFGDFIFLYEGWNLISIPFILSDTNLGVVFNSIKGSYDAVQWYNVSDTFDHWKHNSTKKPSYLNDLNRIDHKKGIWIHITEPGGILFQYPGTKPIENQTIQIHPGWNLIGYPSLTGYNRTVALNNITFGTDVDAIWTYHASTQKWKEITALDIFEAGRGYYIHSKVTKTWIVPL
jgi:parallel beta-helix repeat protein